MIIPDIHLIFDLILFHFTFNFHIGTTPGVGTCTALEKAYCRTGVEVDWSKVRPEPVLAKAFARLQALEDDMYVHDQLRAVRQDLVIGRVASPLTREV